MSDVLDEVDSNIEQITIQPVPENQRTGVAGSACRSCR